MWQDSLYSLSGSSTAQGWTCLLVKGLLKTLITLTTSFIMLSVSFCFPAGYSVAPGKIQLLRLGSTKIFVVFLSNSARVWCGFLKFFPSTDAIWFEGTSRGCSGGVFVLHLIASSYYLALFLSRSKGWCHLKTLVALLFLGKWFILFFSCYYHSEC